MLITKHDLKIVNDFVDNNESFESHYTFPHIDKQLSEVLQEPVEFFVRNHYKDYLVQITTERLSLSIVQEQEFVWKIWLKDTSLQGFMDAQHLINLIADQKITITELYNSILPEVQTRIKFDELYRLSNWGLDKLNGFYNHFSPITDELDTDIGLKIIYRMKIEEWDKVFYKHVDGKRASIDYYRRLFDNFATCLEQIKNMQLHDIPA